MKLGGGKQRTKCYKGTVQGWLDSEGLAGNVMG